MTINDCHAEFAVLDDLQLVRVNVRGDLNYKALTDIVAAARALPECRSYNRLYDFRACDLSMSIHDLYSFPRVAASMQSVRSKVVRAALLVPENKDFERYSFYETTAQNVGFNLHVFTCKESALDWVVDARIAM